MYEGLKLQAPFFELGPKAYIFGQELVALARFADVLTGQYDVPIIITPQTVDIRLLVKETKNLLIFAQHMDSLRIGRGIGVVLPEAIKAAGAVGTLLNHAEKPIPHEILIRTIQRADEVGLASMVCASSLDEVELVSRMNPNIVIAEAPELIGTGARPAQDRENIEAINALVWSINPDIRVLHAAGISGGSDVYNIIASGAQATGSTSGVLRAEDPFAMLEEMVRCVRKAWDDTHIDLRGR
jgi:triosephosphate isomerase